MLPTIQLGPLTLQAPGLILLLAVWIGLSRAEKVSHHAGISADRFYNLALVMLTAGLIGARLGYAARNIDAFLASPASLLALSPQMLSATDGIIIAFAAGIGYTQKAKIPVLHALDALAPALAILMVGSHLANFASGAAFGAPTRLFWGIQLWGETRHPVQLLEALAAALIAFGIWPRAGSAAALPPGLRFVIFLGATALARLWLELLRGDGGLVFGGLRQAQVTAWVVLALAAAAGARLLNPGQKPGK